MTKSMEEMTWQDVEPGGVITEPGNAACYFTGTWRSQRPRYDEEVCNRCWRCFVMCPDAAISPDYERNVFVWNYNYCKGCGICAYECPVDAITMEEEGK
ncbi:MAG: 4Fe-4S binding protein [Deltaproteobacteria bacterium]|nr:4Fe-4S binding protein [Deltaproteobacteria bacterium]